jgi:hypothetical protein
MRERFVLVETTTQDASRDDIQNGLRMVNKISRATNG